MVVGAVAFFLLRLPRGGSALPAYQTETVTVATLIVQVSATGNLQPTNVVEVGSELSGIVTEVLVDENDVVAKGQVLARLDLSKLEDAVDRSRASLAIAEAQVEQARATVEEAQASLDRLNQVAELSGGKVPSRTELDAATASLKRARADEAGAQATIAQAKASLKSDETNLEKGSIRSSIDGVVLTRDVEPGQTVAATLQAPVLFTLAEDLARMELEVDVDEADVAHVAVGQHATFTVDAWPSRRFDALITRVAFGSQEVDGVVTYPTVLSVANDDLDLRPGMTGNAEIVTLTRENAVLVPNAALRFTPSAEPTGSGGSGGSILTRLLPGPPGRKPKAQAAPSNGRPRVWVLRDGEPVPVEVETGATDGKSTEIVDGLLSAGDEVITETLSGANP